MAKVEKDKRPCHKLKRVNVETFTYKTACGLKLTTKERQDVVLTDDWQHVTCPACRKENK